MRTEQQRLVAMRRTSCCVRCGVVRYRSDGQDDPPVCGLCAVKEMLVDDTWAKPTNSHAMNVWTAAREYMLANSDATVVAELACDRSELPELKRRLGIKAQAAA